MQPGSISDDDSVFSSRILAKETLSIVSKEINRNKGAGSVNPDSAILELELKRCLQVTWVANNRGDRSDLRRADRGVRVTELWMVEDIERLKPELEIHLLVDRERFED